MDIINLPSYLRTFLSDKSATPQYYIANSCLCKLLCRGWPSAFRPKNDDAIAAAAFSSLARRVCDMSLLQRRRLHGDGDVCGGWSAGRLGRTHKGTQTLGVTLTLVVVFSLSSSSSMLTTPNKPGGWKFFCPFAEATMRCGAT